MASSAERQRRHRAHKRGDHSLCDPARRCDVTPGVTPEHVTPRAPRLGVAGMRLWADLDGESSEGGRRVLVVEACRITDRLAKLDRLLTGEAEDWIRLAERKGSDEVAEIVIDKPLSEARQQAIALKQLISELRQLDAPAGQRPVPVSASGGARAGGVTDISARIAARRAQAAG